MDQLTASLLDLLHELHGVEIPITVGGGFGLYLKRRPRGERARRPIPRDRSGPIWEPDGGGGPAPP
jgi:hypothetical protein